MHIFPVIGIGKLSNCKYSKIYIFKSDLNGDNDITYITSFEIVFQTQDESKENECCSTVCIYLVKRHDILSRMCFIVA